MQSRYSFRYIGIQYSVLSAFSPELDSVYVAELLDLQCTRWIVRLTSIQRDSTNDEAIYLQKDVQTCASYAQTSGRWFPIQRCLRNGSICSVPCFGIRRADRNAGHRLILSVENCSKEIDECLHLDTRHRREYYLSSFVAVNLVAQIPRAKTFQVCEIMSLSGHFYNTSCMHVIALFGIIIGYCFPSNVRCFETKALLVCRHTAYTFAFSCVRLNHKIRNIWQKSGFTFVSYRSRYKNNNRHSLIERESIQ